MTRVAFALLALTLATAAAACAQEGPVDTSECVAGCSETPPTPTGCTSDALCGSGNVCANDGACYPADQVRIAHVTWTVAGAPASAATCAADPDLELDITSTTVMDVPGNYGEGYTPVPCAEGEFSFDKLPLIYDGVALDAYESSSTATASGMFDGSGDVALDLQ